MHYISRLVPDIKPRLAYPITALDVSTSEFPGIRAVDNGYHGPSPTPASHPHLRLEQAMTSAPQVKPGDMVFWHCVCLLIGIPRINR
jgi:hypothetical protein